MKTKFVYLLHHDGISSKMAPLLTGMGYQVRTGWPEEKTDTAADFCIMSCESFDSRLLNSVNSQAIQKGLPILFVVVDEFRVRIGPVVFPGESGCLQCFEQRTFASSEFPEVLETSRSQMRKAGPEQVSETLNCLAASLAIVEVSKYLDGVPHLLDLGRVAEYDALSGTLESGIVLRSPRCEVCGQHMPAQTPRSVAWTA